MFNAVPAYTPGGNDLVNTLQDEDFLTGAGINPTLNVTIGSVNDAAEYIIMPTLNGVETVNVKINDDAAGIDFQEATGLKTLNLTGLSSYAGYNSYAWLLNLDKSTTNLGINNVSSLYGDVYFQYREEVLTGTNDTVNVALNSSRLAYVSLYAGTDGGADDGYSFETINLRTTGTNDIDAVYFAANVKEDVLAEKDADTTKQVLNITAGAAAGATGSLEINELYIGGVDTMSIVANQRVDIAADKAAALSVFNDGIYSPDLETLTITGAGNVMIDGLEGQVSTEEVEAGLTVNAAALTGNLRLGVVSANAADEYLSVTSGSGNDEIETYGPLGGDIVTNAGNDTVRVTDVVSLKSAYDSALTAYNANPTGAGLLAALNTARANLAAADNTVGDMKGTASISTGAGNDKVYAAVLDVTEDDKDEVANGGFDDVSAASIVTGEGNDEVTATYLNSGEDWDNGSLTDSNVDDLYMLKGASVVTGTGNDTIKLGTATVSAKVAEGAVVDAGEGDDTVSMSVSGHYATVLAGDKDADRAALATETKSGNTKEVGATGAVDRLGAIVDLGAGSADVASFTETNSKVDTENSITIVGRDAELRSAETVSVTALDSVNVTTVTLMADQDDITTGVQNDINANVLGTKTLNLTIANQIDATTAAATGAKQNDDNEVGATITANVMRFDAALATVNLVSQEQTMLQKPSAEEYEAGTLTTFTLNNMREGVALNLTANEATGVDVKTGVSDADQIGFLKDDTLLAINATTGVVTTANAADVTLNVDYASARDLDDSAVLNVTATSGAFDLDLNLGSTTTDTADEKGDGTGNKSSTTDDDAKRIENFAVKFADANSHSIDANGFGDVVFRGVNDRPAAVAGDVSSTAVTSFTVWSAAAAGKSIAVDAVNADTIAFRNVDGTAVTAANVTLRVDAENNYTITTGSGTDIVDMRADVVRSDDNDTAVNRADTIDLGAGRDILILSGSNNMSSHDLDLSVITDVATVINDDVFKTMSGVETLVFDANVGGAVVDIVLDEAAKATGVDTLRLLNGDAHTMRLVIGNNFEVASTAANGELTTAASALVIDATQHVTQTNIEIENKDDDTDVQTVNLDVRVTSQGGADIRVGDRGSATSTIELRVIAQEAVGTDIDADDATDADGQVDILVDTGEYINKIVMVDTPDDASNDPEGALVVDIEADWTGTEFEFDASALTDTDGTTAVPATATGGMTFNIEAGDTAKFTVRGTQNDDTINGSNQDDKLYGNGGDDTISGAAGDDTIEGGDGKDVLKGEGGADTIVGGAGDDKITGGTLADTLTGGTGEDTFYVTTALESTQSAADTITDFVSGTDKLDIDLGTVANGSVVNFGRFNTVANLGAGDNSLDGTVANKVIGDAFYSTDGKYVLDVDGDGDITDLADVVVNSTGAIAAGDVNYTVNIAGGDNIVRLGQGVDKVATGTGKDTFVIVGAISEAQRTAYINAADNVPTVLEKVLPEADLQSVRTATEANAGDTIDGGLGDDTLHTWGDVNLGLVNNGGALNVENVVVHSSVILTAAQITALGDDKLTVVGDMAHSITVDGNAGTIADLLRVLSLDGAGSKTSYTFTAKDGVLTAAWDAADGRLEVVSDTRTSGALPKDSALSAATTVVAGPFDYAEAKIKFDADQTGYAVSDTLSNVDDKATASLAQVNEVLAAASTVTITAVSGNITDAPTSGYDANVDNYQLTSGAGATMTVAQYDKINGADGTNTVTFAAADYGTISAKAIVEGYVLGDDSNNAVTVSGITQGQTVEATTAGDAVTVEVSGTFTGNVTGAGTDDRLVLANNTNVAGANSGNAFTGVTNLTIATSGSVTMTAAQHQGLTTTSVNAAGTGASGETVSITTAGAVTASSVIENYVLSALGNAITVQAATNVTAGAGADTIVVGANVLTGSYTGLASGDKITVSGDGSNLATAKFGGMLGAATGAGTLEFANVATTKTSMTIAQNNGFTTVTGTASNTHQVTLTDAGTITGRAYVDTYVLANAAGNVITLGDDDPTGEPLLASDQSVTGATGYADTVKTGTLTALSGDLTLGSTGDDILEVSTTGTDISGINTGGATTAEKLVIVGTVGTGGTVTMTLSQHNGFTSIDAAGSADKIVVTNQFIGTADNDVETYDLNGQGNTITLTAGGVNVLAGAGDDLIVINGGTLGAKTIDGEAHTTDDTIRLKTGSNIAAATISNVELMGIDDGASVTMTSAQFGVFSNALSSEAAYDASGTETVTFTTAVTDDNTGNLAQAIEKFVFSSGNDTFGVIEVSTKAPALDISSGGSDVLTLNNNVLSGTSTSNSVVVTGFDVSNDKLVISLGGSSISDGIFVNNFAGNSADVADSSIIEIDAAKFQVGVSTNLSDVLEWLNLNTSGETVADGGQFTVVAYNGNGTAYIYQVKDTETIDVEGEGDTDVEAGFKFDAIELIGTVNALDNAFTAFNFG